MCMTMTVSVPTSSLNIASDVLQAAKPELAQVGRIGYEDGFVGGECIFIPSKPDDHAVRDGDGNGGEDDGYLVTFVSRKDGTGNSGKTKFIRRLDAWLNSSLSSVPTKWVVRPIGLTVSCDMVFLSWLLFSLSEWLLFFCSTSSRFCDVFLRLLG